jgi:cellulose synthase/poly-beta-1,6-N-acetylglucosamine synthase-like glycosyltransferase
VEWPAALTSVVVVADNCADQTAARAAAAGARVLERTSASQRGKGYALALAFETLLAEGGTDAIVVVDADTVVSKGLLTAFAARLERGATAVQADYGVRNPDASWRTRLMAVALGMFHVLRSRGRERLQTSCGLRGNGMCFSAALLREVPHDAFSVVEDLEYGIRLGEAGHRVHYADEAHVYGEMVSSERASRSQRQRWEGGRAKMRREHGLRLLLAGLRASNRVLFDLGCDLLVPPLASLVALVALGLGLSALVAALAGGSVLPTVLFAVGLSALVAYVLRGWALSGTGARGLRDLLFAPVYVAWKVALLVAPGRARPSEWVRTTREGGQR